MEGYLTLVDIAIPRSGLVSSKEKKYTGVTATFCQINWKVQEQDPTKVPMFKDLRKESLLCRGTLYQTDLWEISRMAKDYDHRNHTFAATSPREGQGPVEPTAVVFHQSRCGSTLIANMLAAFRPKHTRVYSESPPPLEAIIACSGHSRCDDGAQDALIQDVFYMMGRITRKERPQHVFYKIQSISSLEIHAFTRAMPDTPWVYSYRDPTEILMSHFKNYQHGNPLSSSYRNNCSRNFGKKDQHPVLVDLVEQHGMKVEDLDLEQYCAAHLASLGESAVREHDSNEHMKTPHWFVNHNELPRKIWEKVLGTVITDTKMTDEMIQRIQQMAHSYSKSRGDPSKQDWHEDSTMKQGRAPESIKIAAQTFMNPVYNKMEQIRNSEL